MFHQQRHVSGHEKIDPHARGDAIVVVPTCCTAALYIERSLTHRRSCRIGSSNSTVSGCFGPATRFFLRVFFSFRLTILFARKIVLGSYVFIAPPAPRALVCLSALFGFPSGDPTRSYFLGHFFFKWTDDERAACFHRQGPRSELKADDAGGRFFVFCLPRPTITRMHSHAFFKRENRRAIRAAYFFSYWAGPSDGLWMVIRVACTTT